VTEAAVIALAIAVLVESIILTTGAARYVDIIERYLTESEARRRLTGEVAALQTQKAAAEDRIARLEKAFFETTGTFTTVANLDGLSTSDLRDLVNGVVRTDEGGEGADRDASRSAETVPNHVAARESGRPGRDVPR
jgi:hypothetical protein